MRARKTMMLIREASWLAAARVTLLLTIAAFYCVNIVLMMRLGKTVGASIDDDRSHHEIEQ